jgi:hypothetical protein
MVIISSFVHWLIFSYQMMFLSQVLPSNDGNESSKLLFNEQKWPSNGVPHVSVTPFTL